MKKPLGVARIGEINSHIFPITLFSIFFTAILILVSAGSTIYVSLVDSQSLNNDTRGSLSYLSARLKAGDSSGGVIVSQGPESNAVVLRETDSEGDSYETRIYLYDGYLCEEYSFANTPIAPKSSTRIAKTNKFDVKILQDNLLELTTQQGNTRVALRNFRGISS